MTNLKTRRGQSVKIEIMPSTGLYYIMVKANGVWRYPRTAENGFDTQEKALAYFENHKEFIHG